MKNGLGLDLPESRERSPGNRALFRMALLVFPLLLLLGGAGDDYPLVGALVECAALVLLVAAVRPGTGVGPVGPAGRIGAALAVAIALLPLLQLVPLPGTLALSLPGRSLARDVLTAAGLSFRWHPLSLAPGDTLEAAFELLPAMAMFVAALRLDRRGHIACLGLVLAAAIVSTLLGGLQRAAGLADIYTTAHVRLAPGLFVNRNHQATFLLIAIVLTPVVVAALLPRARRTERLTLTAALGFLFAAGVLATASRAGLLILLPALVVAALLCVGVPRRAARLVPVAGAGALLAAALIRLPAVQFVLARFAHGDDRPSYWTDTLRAARDVLPAGSGIASFTDIFPAYEGAAIVNTARVNAAHNDYVQLLMEGGAPALVLFVAAMGLLAWAAARLVRRRDPGTRALGWASLAGIAIILLHSLVDYPLRMGAIMAVAGLLAGIVTSMADRPTPLAARVTQTRRHGTGAAWPVRLAAMPLFVLILGAAMARHASAPRWLLPMAPLSADARVRAGNQAFDANAVAVAETDALRALSLAPLHAGALELLVRVRDAQARWPDLDRLLTLADRETKRDGPIRYMLLTRAAERGDFDTAMADVDLLLRQHLYEAHLYPYLRTASSDPAVRRALARRLARDPIWRRDLIGGLRGLEPADHLAFAALLHEMRATARPPTAAEIEPFLLRLIAAGEAGLARAVRDDGSRAVAAPLLRDPTFTFPADTGQAGMFGWHLTNRSDTSRDPGGAGLAIAGSGRGAVVDQTTLLPPGDYVLRWTVRTGRASAPAALRWDVACVPRGAKARLGLPQPSTSGRSTVTVQTLDIPAGCPAQVLTLSFDGDPIETGAVTIERADLGKM